jgi:hypothetical protein
MQISGVSLTLFTLPLRLCLLRVLLGATAAATSFPLSQHTGGGGTTLAFSSQRVYLQLTWEVGLPPSCGVFLPPPLLQAFLLLVAGCVPLLLPSLSGLFIYSSHGKWVFPPLLWSFPPTTAPTSFRAPGRRACATAPAFSSWLVV